MKLFGETTAVPAWFAAEVLRLLVLPKNENDERDRASLTQLIHQQAAKLELQREDVEADLRALGVSPAVALDIADRYESQRVELRRSLLLPENFVAMHNRVVRTEVLENSDHTKIALQDDTVMQMHLTETAKPQLILALKEAVTSLERLT